MSQAEDTVTSVPDLSSMFEKQRVVALAVSSCGGRADGSDINSRVEFRSNLVRHHAQQLVKKGVLRETGNRNDNGPGDPAVEYELTEQGKASVSRYRGLQDGLTTEGRIEELEVELRSTQNELDELEGRFERLLERLGEN